MKFLRPPPPPGPSFRCLGANPPPGECVPRSPPIDPRGLRPLHLNGRPGLHRVPVVPQAHAAGRTGVGRVPPLVPDGFPRGLLILARYHFYPAGTGYFLPLHGTTPLGGQVWVWFFFARVHNRPGGLNLLAQYLLFASSGVFILRLNHAL